MSNDSSFLTQPLKLYRLQYIDYKGKKHKVFVRANNEEHAKSQIVGRSSFHICCELVNCEACGDATIIIVLDQCFPCALCGKLGTSE